MTQVEEMMTQVEERKLVKWKTQAVRTRIAGYALPAILVLFIAVFSALQPDIFPTTRTLQTLLRTESVSAILAIALIFPLAIGEFDLSVASVLGLSAILVTGLPSMHSLPMSVSIVIAIVACAFIGLINGLLVAQVGISALVATLGISVIVAGSVYWYTNGNVIYTNIPPELPDLAQKDVLGVPLPAIFLVVVAAAAWYILDETPLGRYFYAVGGSKDAARLSGLNVKRLIIIAYVVAGLLAGLAGIYRRLSWERAIQTSVRPFFSQLTPRHSWALRPSRLIRSTSRVLLLRFSQLR